MNFAIYYSLRPFVSSLNPGCTVHITSYKQQENNLVLLTSDAGLDGGTIQVVQITVTNKPDNADEPPATDPGAEAFHSIYAFLKGKGMKVREGVLLTAGLQEALRFWGGAGQYSLSDITEELDETGKAVKVNER